MERPVTRRTFLAASGAGLGAAAMPAAEADASTPGEATMPLRPLGKLGWLVPIVGFGGGSRFLLQKDLDVVERMIARAVDLGIRYFDTAYDYRTGDAPESLRRYGKYLVPRFRKEITLSTKLSARDAEGAKRQLDESLRLLGTDRLDILHFHSVSTREDTDRITAKGGALEAYTRWKDEGVIRAIGITGHQDAEVLLDAVRRIEPDCVMCPQNPAHDGPMVNGAAFARLVNPHALARGIGLLGMKSTGQNRLVGKGDVSAEALVRYALALPVAAVVIGMPDLDVVESCARIARTLKPMTEGERERMQSRVAVAAIDGTLPYLAAGYRDEGCAQV